MSKYGIPIILCTLTLSTLVDRLTGRHVNKYGIPIMHCTHIFTSQPVNPGRQGDRSTDEQVRRTHNALHSYIYLSTFLPINHSTKVNRSRVKYRSVRHYGYSVLVHCRPVNPSTRVDRSRGKYMSARDYG